MAREEHGDVMQQPEMSPDMMEELMELQEDDDEEKMMDQSELNEMYKDPFGAPELEEKQNAHSFLHKAAFSSPDTTRTTFLSESELGRPLFSVRWLLDMEDLVKSHIDPLIIKLEGVPERENKIANYFKAKVGNVTDSGMSNKGFSMNLNVTRKMDATRMRVKSDQTPLKGGKI